MNEKKEKINNFVTIYENTCKIESGKPYKQGLARGQGRNENSPR